MSSKKVVDLRGKKPLGATPPPPQVRMAARIPERRKAPPLRVRRQRARYSLSGVLIFLCLIIAAGISWFSYSSYLAIKNIQVVGAQTVSPDAISAIIESQLHVPSHAYFSPNTIFTYHQSAIQHAVLQGFPRIKDIALSRSSPLSQTLIVTIHERAPYAQWCTDTQACYLMDDTGYIYTAFDASASTSTIATAYTFSGGIGTSTDPIGASFVSAHIPGIVTFMKLLEQFGYHPTRARVENEQDFNVNLTEGYLIKASFGENADMLMRNLRLILTGGDGLQSKAGDIEYIDLRFGDRVYYKLKDGTTQITASTTSSLH
jgi:cell division septal protein FtsQ